MKKYEFVSGDTITSDTGATLTRIRALVDIPRYAVNVGDLGGYLESESNLSHAGDCWVYDSARVLGNAQVFDNARVYGDAQVFDNARVLDNARVFDNAQVYGSARVFADVRVLWSCGKTPPSVNTSDGYTMTLNLKEGKISAGCRYFTFEEAEKHWKKTRGRTLLGKERLLNLRMLQLAMETK